MKTLIFLVTIFTLSFTALADEIRLSTDGITTQELENAVEYGVKKIDPTYTVASDLNIIAVRGNKKAHALVVEFDMHLYEGWHQRCSALIHPMVHITTEDRKSVFGFKLLKDTCKPFSN